MIEKVVKYTGAATVYCVGKRCELSSIKLRIAIYSDQAASAIDDSNR